MNRTPERLESLPQARNFDKRVNAFLGRGCCPACSAQAAYGHQDGIGFARINPPCPQCVPIVSAFPVATVNPLWRTVPQSARKAPVSPLKTDLMGTRTLPRVGTTPTPTAPSERAA